MKRFIFSILFLSAFALGLQAQSSSCAKKCTGKSATAASCHAKVGTASAYTVPAEHQAAAARLAKMDNSIEVRNNETGVSYVRKETCGHSGSVSYVDLSFDAANGAFVNVSPTATTTSTTPAAGCGPAKAAGGKAACCASKAKTSTASTTNAAEAKPVKSSGGTKN